MDAYVELAVIIGARSKRHSSSDAGVVGDAVGVDIVLFGRIDHQVGLLPMCCWIVGPCMKDDRGGVSPVGSCRVRHRVALGEAHVEPDGESVEGGDVLVEIRGEILVEGEVLFRAAVKVQIEELTNGADDGADWNGSHSSILIYMSRKC